MPDRTSFERDHPGVFYLDTTYSDELLEYLRVLGWLGKSEQIRSIKKAGEGNMNLTVRVRTDLRSFILKQARPWVEKYPHILAPWDRALVEGRFYELVASHPALARRMPKLLGLDHDARLLCLEDLGESPDFSSVYAGDEIHEAEMASLLDYLAELHGAFHGAASRDVFSNREMRGLNHQHIFVLPLAGIADPDYKRKVLEAGEIYLSDGEYLLHGDYFPGSWLRSPAGVRIIDPEFCFFGPREFDAGVMLAHLHLASQPRHLMDMLLEACSHLDRALLNRFAGIEIMRRLLGVAKLPLTIGDAQKQALLDLSRELV